MKHVKIYEEINNKYGEDFHCYIPYVDRNLFILALSKIDVDNSLKNDIIKNFDKNIFPYVESHVSQVYQVGFFLRFYDLSKIIKNQLYVNNWDFYNVSNYDDVNGLSKDMEVTRNKSLYIGEIKLEDWEIQANKYNL